MKKSIFKILAKANRFLMPSFGKKDLMRLTKTEKAIVAYRYWVTINALD